MLNFFLPVHFTLAMLAFTPVGGKMNQKRKNSTLQKGILKKIKFV
jgi:hypothetical protein